MTENESAAIVIGEAIDIHKAIGPGLLEEVYVECLYYRLIKLGLRVEKERADLILENKFIVEAKSIDAIADIHITRTLTYLKFSGCKFGLRINFNVTFKK